jgi:branched-chain amino acid transport system ATP-binding protein
MSMLEVKGLAFRYGRATVLDGIDLTVGKGEIVTVIGPNGAGKSTLLNVVARSLRPRDGSIKVAGEETRGLNQAGMVKLGCILVPEGRQVFASLDVRDNLLLGRYTRRRESGLHDELDHVYHVFPRLKEREKQLAGTLSGGEQQMLAIGRAIMGKPGLMLLDEPSLGLSPQFVHRIMGALSTLRDEGLTILLVEQNARAALELADRGYLMQTGRVVTEGSAALLKADPTVQRVYLGGAAPTAVEAS